MDHASGWRQRSFKARATSIPNTSLSTTRLVMWCVTFIELWLVVYNYKLCHQVFKEELRLEVIVTSSFTLLNSGRM